MNLEDREEKIGIGDSERCVEIPWALSKYSDEQTVLDVGYANAELRYLTALLSLKIPNLHGIDISGKKIEGMTSKVGDVRNTNFENDYFDLIFCISTMEHIGRDNSKYLNNFTENLKNGDFDALQELCRIIKNEGKIIITVPFGKLFNYGWFIQYDEKRLNELVSTQPLEIICEEYFKYCDGWYKCDKSELKDTLYQDNNAPAAAGLACILLKKVKDKTLLIQHVKSNGAFPDMDNATELQKDNINIEEIMEKIRENIRRRQIAGEVPPDPDSVIASTSRICPKIELDDSNQRDLSFINANWDIHNNSYFISSHNPYLGKFLVKGRQIVHGEIRRYVDPMVSRQTEFNATTTRIISLISRQYLELDHRQQDFEIGFSSYRQNSDKMLVDYISTAKNELDLKIESASIELATVKENLDLKIESASIELATVKENLDSKIESASNELATVKEIFSQMEDDMHARAWLVHALEDRFQKALKQKSAPLASSKKLSNYFLFEERFRGSRNAITQRQGAFLPYFEKCSNVLDIGCGRGEFLEILKNNAIGSSGIDSDPDMVAYCRSRHLDVVQSDAIRYLETLEDKSLDGIFIDQVVEHLESDYLIRLIALCYQKMKFGYHIVIETVNPTSFVSFVNFYIDMTHKRPVHPETLQYLIGAAGFRECEKMYFSAVSDEDRLKKFEEAPDVNENERRNVDVYNQNIEKLNSILFGAQDYAVVGKK